MAKPPNFAPHPCLAPFALLALAAGLALTAPAVAADRGSAPESLGNTPLHGAALAGDAREVRRLIDAGADARATNQAGATPLHYGTGSERVVQLLLRAGADPNARSVAGSTPLHTAAARPGGTAVVRRLLDAGADIEATRPIFPVGGVTPLGVASGAGPGDEQTVALLLARGAAPTGTLEAPPLAWAAYAGHAGIVRRLVEHGAPPNFDDGFAGHALNAALYAGHDRLVPFLVERGADLHQRSSFGEAAPPMVWAAYNESGDPAVARLLLDRGVDINEPTSTGDTALRWALKRGETPLTAFLRSRGASEGPRPAKNKEVPRNPIPEDLAGRQRLARDAAQRAVALLQRSSDAFLANGFVQASGCVSCHQQTLPAVAFGRAQERGLRVDEAALARQLRAQHVAWSRNRDRAYEMHEPQPDSPANLGYGLLGLKALGFQPDDLTAAMVWYLAQSQRPDGSWPAYDRRPPMEEGVFVGTALAVGALRLYPQPLPDPALDRRFALARRWLEQTRPADLNQRAFRLLGLGWAGAPAWILKRHARDLAALQRPDGGWAPLPGLESDAWATGQSLFALHEAGGIPVEDPVYQRGVAFLLRTQFPDGSWWVQSRTWPFQPHFDSEFPHGKDQWISAGGTGWAAIALLDLLPATTSRASLPTAQALMAKAATRPANPAPQPPSTPSTPSAASAASAAHASAQAPEFARDILPLLQRSCVECHSGEKPKGGLRADSPEALLKGGQSGEPSLVRGRSGASPLVRLIADEVEDLEMPPVNRRTKFPALTPAEIQKVRDWIDHGAH